MRVLTCLTLAVLCGCAQESHGKANDGSSVSATDQSESAADLAVTKNIRQALVGTSEFSTSAQNVTVVSRNGVVTLRGDVATTDEKSRIEAIARDHSGSRRIDNQLTIQ